MAHSNVAPMLISLLVCLHALHKEHQKPLKYRMNCFHVTSSIKVTLARLWNIAHLSIWIP